MATADVISALQQSYPELGFEPRPLVKYPDGRDSGQMWVRVPADRLVEVMRFLRDDARTKMEQLSELTCVDYLSHLKPPSDERFGVTYGLLSITHNHRLFIKVFVSDPDPTVPTVTSVWKGAEWMEREVYDLFGIRFAGHPDLRRILCPEWFQHHPLRKDYPLRGVGEREQFEVIQRDST